MLKKMWADCMKKTKGDKKKCKEMEFFASWKDAADIEKADHKKVDWKKLIAERKATFSKMTKADWIKYKKSMPMLKKMWADCMKKTKGDKNKCKEMEFFASWRDAYNIEHQKNRVLRGRRGGRHGRRGGRHSRGHHSRRGGRHSRRHSSWGRHSRGHHSRRGRRHSHHHHSRFMDVRKRDWRKKMMAFKKEKMGMNKEKWAAMKKAAYYKAKMMLGKKKSHMWTHRRSMWGRHSRRHSSWGRHSRRHHSWGRHSRRHHSHRMSARKYVSKWAMYMKKRKSMWQHDKKDFSRFHILRRKHHHYRIPEHP